MASSTAAVSTTSCIVLPNLLHGIFLEKESNFSSWWKPTHTYTLCSILAHDWIYNMTWWPKVQQQTKKGITQI